MQKFLWLVGSILLTLGCGTQLPERNPEEAWVDVSGRAGYQLSAMRLDGNEVNDARYFQFPPGRHRLEVRLGYERRGGSGTQWRYCKIEIDYDEFVAGQQYWISAVAVGFTVRAWLNADGQGRLMESHRIKCGVQY